jgi:Leucine-rich repeat (LRR) protein
VIRSVIRSLDYRNGDRSRLHDKDDMSPFQYSSFAEFNTARQKRSREATAEKELLQDVTRWRSITADPKLAKLELGTFKIDRVSSQVGRLTTLTSLDLSSQCLGLTLGTRTFDAPAFPDNLANLTNLVDVNLHQNASLKGIPDVAGYWKNLARLDVSGCEQKKLSTMVFYFRKLEHLNFSQNKLARCVKCIAIAYLLSRIRVLFLTIYAIVNCLYSIPESLCLLGNLKTLLLRNNLLRELPNRCFPVSLESLDLGNNLLTALPKALAHCSRLETLDLSSNQLETIGATSFEGSPIQADSAEDISATLKDPTRKSSEKDLELGKEVEQLLQLARENLQTKRIATLNELVDTDVRDAYRAAMDDETDEHTFLELMRLEYSSESSKKSSQSSIQCSSDTSNDAALSGLCRLRQLSLSGNSHLKSIGPGIRCLSRLEALDISHCVILKDISQGNIVVCISRPSTAGKKKLKNFI